MRRRGYVAGAVAALVLLVVPLGLVPYVLAPVPAEDAPGTQPELSRLVVAGDADAAAALTCDGHGAPPRALPLKGTLEAARLCATSPRYRRWTAPEPLFTHLDVLAEGLDALEAAPEDYGCFQSGDFHHYDLRLVVDGAVVSLRTQPNCGELTAAGSDYLNSTEAFDAYLAALSAQRAGHEPPALMPTTALDCNPGQPWQDYPISPLGDASDMVEAVSCWRPDSKGDVGPRSDAVPVQPADLTTMMAEVRTSTRRDSGFDDEPCGDGPWYWQDLLGRTVWGDVVVLRGVCKTFLVSDAESTTPEDQEFWYPSLRAQRILDGLRR